jgi:hypothetical protein
MAATYVLVPGGGQGDWCYRSVARLLRYHGHDMMVTEPAWVAEKLMLVTPEKLG